MMWGAPQESPQAKEVAATVEKAVDVSVHTDLAPSGNQVLAEGIRGLYERRELCDACLTVGGEKFPVHRAMLASMSSNFRGFLHQLPSRSAAGASTEAGTDPMKGMLTLAAAAAPPPPSPTAAGAAPPAAAPSASAEGASAPQGGPAPPAPAPPAAAQPAPPPAAPATPLEGARAEFQVAGVQSPEAMRIMLDYVYLVGTGAPWEYKPSSAEVNKDILRLARSFGLDHLHEHAARWLARGLTTTNVVERLVTCEEFGLGLLREKIIEQLGANPAELMIVSSSPAIMKHPHILQDLLVKVASCNAAATAAKKAAAEPVAEVVPMAVEKPEAKAEEAADKPADSKSQQKASTRAETKAEKAAAAERAAADKPTAKRAKRGAAGA